MRVADSKYAPALLLACKVTKEKKCKQPDWKKKGKEEEEEEEALPSIE